MKKMDSAFNSLVLGIGQVGTAIAKILGCEGIDKGDIAIHKHYKFLHICFPFKEDFVEQVKIYQEQYTPDYTICHSTVPVGTSRRCNMVHSPVRGKHPDLEKGIRTFTKYFGGSDAYVCAELFKEKGIKVLTTPNPEDTESAKLFDTLIYGINILLEKEIYKFCQDNSLNFDLVYTDFSKTYNSGYEELGHPQYKKYILKHIDGPLGGHCVQNNAEFLDTPFAKLLCRNTRSWK